MAEDLVVFVGRTVELAVLRRLRAEAEEGRPQTVLVTGPAGIGKTSLIEQFLSEVDDTAVLRASGELWEAFVAFGVIDQLVRAAGVRGGLLLASRQRALPVEEPVGVGAVLLESLERLERKSAVILLVDDAHWADVDSLRALLFALRRLVTARVLTVLAVRDEDATRFPDGLRRMASGATGRSLHLAAWRPVTSGCSRQRSGCRSSTCGSLDGCETTLAATRCTVRVRGRLLRRVRCWVCGPPSPWPPRWPSSTMP